MAQTGRSARRGTAVAWAAIFSPAPGHDGGWACADTPSRTGKTALGKTVCRVAFQPTHRRPSRFAERVRLDCLRKKIVILTPRDGPSETPGWTGCGYRLVSEEGIHARTFSS